MTITEAYQRRCSLASMGCRHDHWHRPDIARIIRDHAPSITDEMDHDLDATTSIELTIEDIDDLIATLTAIKWDAIENRGFAPRAKDGLWTNGIEEEGQA